jgi:hypothetical protein
MQTVPTTSILPSSIAADEGNQAELQAQIAAMRKSLQACRNRARKMWDACAPEVAAEESRAAVGRFTEQLLKGKMDEAYG